MALRDGLTLARELNLNSFIIEMDAMSVVQLMNNDSVNMLMEPLLIDCRTLLRAISNKWIKHSFREANQCTDALARIGSRCIFPFAIFVDPPHVMDAILVFDKANTFCDRLVVSNI